MGAIIRKIGISDLDSLMEWRMRVLVEVFSIPEGTDVSALRESNERYYRKHLDDGSHTSCFAYLDDTVVGCGGICYQDEMPSPDNPSGINGYLMNIFVLPEHRGKGIGRSIVGFLTDDAKAHGAGKIYLESTSTAETLYRSLGFTDMEHYMKLKG